MKLQQKKGTSLSTKLSTVGHGNELEGKLKTMKLQEEKSILPLSEEEPEGLLMKLQRMKGSSPSVVLPPAGQKKELEGRQKTIQIQGEKGSLPSSPLSTTDLEEKLEEVCVKLIRLRKEGKLAVPESSTSHLVKKLAELCMELIRLRMEGTLPPPELFTADLEEELKELQVKLGRQIYHSIRTFQGDIRQLSWQLQEKRTEVFRSIVTFQGDVIELLMQLQEKRTEVFRSIVTFEGDVIELLMQLQEKRTEVFRSIVTFQGDVIELLMQLQEKRTEELEGRPKTFTLQEEIPQCTSLSSVLSTAGHEKELEGRLKTFTLQEEKRILPPSEEELEELLMKLQSMKGTSLSTKLSTAGHGKELEGRLKTMTLQEEKRTWPVREFCASDPEEDLAAELPMKLQGMEVTSPSAAYLTTGHEKEKKGTSLSTKLSTVGHGKELEGKLKTMKLQEEKSILPLSEEEPEGLLMKLQRMKVSSPSVVLPPAGQKKELEGRQKTIKIQGEKGSLPSSPLSTTDLEEKLEEVCVKLIRLRKEGKLAVPESSTSHLVKKLAELCMELIRLRMEGTLPSPELFTADLEEELEELRVKLDRQPEEFYRQRYEGILSTRTFERDVEKLLRQLQEKRMEALENTMYPTIRSGLVKFDVSLPEELQSYVSYLFNESAKLGLRKRALHSLSSVEELREAMDEIELKVFLGIHIREGAWQVALLFMDELSSDELPWDWFVDLQSLWEEEETISSSLYSSTSGILKAWPTEYDPDLVTLCKAITDRDWKVTGLILCRSRISEEGLKNLSTALTHGELYSLALCNSDLQSRGLKHLCEALISRDCNLTSLNVSGNLLGAKGIMHLCNVLTSVNCKLTSLNVSDNQLGAEGIMYLCNVLISVKGKLTSFNVSWNCCGNEGLKHLCDALVSTNCTLTRLNASFSRVGDRALKDLGSALTNKNCALTSLDIRRNKIGDEGIKHLCKALTDPNCKLRSLDLRGNGKVTDVGKQCLSEATTGTDWEVRGGLVLSRSIKSEA